eukprot:scaffold376_cov156-Amphora_coffeaeformis.AAC.8
MLRIKNAMVSGATAAARLLPLLDGVALLRPELAFLRGMGMNQLSMFDKVVRKCVGWMTTIWQCCR